LGTHEHFVEQYLGKRFCPRNHSLWCFTACHLVDVTTRQSSQRNSLGTSQIGDLRNDGVPFDVVSDDNLVHASTLRDEQFSHCLATFNLFAT
jgi:hypothetical protein